MPFLGSGDPTVVSRFTTFAFARLAGDIAPHAAIPCRAVHEAPPLLLPDHHAERADCMVRRRFPCRFRRRPVLAGDPWRCLMTKPAQHSIFGGYERDRGSKFPGPPQGYAAPPGGGPPGETCGTCGNCRVLRVRDHNLYKCGLRSDQWTRDRETDVLKGSPACAKFHKGQPQHTNAWGKIV